MASTRAHVVLLHSSGLSGRQWRALAEQLSSGYQVHAPDFLGSGREPAWPDGEPFHFQQDVDAIARLCAPMERVHLVGHSYGGFVASCLARQHPALLRSLTLYDPVAFGLLHDAADPIGLTDLARAEQAPRFFDPASGGDDDWMRAFVDFWNGPGAWRALPAPMRQDMLRVGKKVFGEVTSLLRDRTPRAAYGVIAAPTLLLTGEGSPPAAQRVVELLAAAIRDARVVRISGAGHMGPITHADQVNAEIGRHLDGVRA